MAPPERRGDGEDQLGAHTLYLGDIVVERDVVVAASANHCADAPLEEVPIMASRHREGFRVWRGSFDYLHASVVREMQSLASVRGLLPDTRGVGH